MLRIAIRDLQRGPVPTSGKLPADDPVLAGLDLSLDGPVEVEGELQATDGEDFLWRGNIGVTVRLPCRRCLADVEYRLDRHVDVLLTGDPEAAEDPSVYPLPEEATHVDLGAVVREELALEVPGFVLCRDDCAGLCPKCGADLNAGPCLHARSAEPV